MTVSFVDDLAAVVAPKRQVDVPETVRAVKSWGERAGLALANTKTEGVLITNYRKKRRLSNTWE